MLLFLSINNLIMNRNKILRLGVLLLFLLNSTIITCNTRNHLRDNLTLISCCPPEPVNQITCFCGCFKTIFDCYVFSTKDTILYIVETKCDCVEVYGLLSFVYRSFICMEIIGISINTNYYHTKRKEINYHQSSDINKLQLWLMQYF